MEAFKSFVAVLWRGKVTVGLPRVFEFGYDHMHAHGWNYYVLHCGIVTVWVSDPRVGGAQ
jgi:hypothetical protein